MNSSSLNHEQRREQEYLRYRERVRLDEETWVAENLDARLEKPLQYHYANGELWSEQGDDLGQIFKDSVDHYEALAKLRPELAFQARRSRAEYKEYGMMKAIAEGAAPNTLVVITPLPRELEGTEEPVLGYQPARGLGFIRVITRQDDGGIRMWTHSFDKSDHLGIEAMYSRLGRTVDWGRDVLEQPIRLNIESSEWRDLLGDELLQAYDSSLKERFGGSWRAGRNEDDNKEATAFVAAQSDLVEAHVEALIHAGPKSHLANQLRYDFAAAMRRRHEGDNSHRDASEGSIAAEMAGAGHQAAQRGEDASGCGLTISAEQTYVSPQLEAAGYKLAPGEKRLDDCMQCPLCKSVGVLVEKDKSGNKHYTCASSGGCGSTTKPEAPNNSRVQQSKTAFRPLKQSAKSADANSALPPARRSARKKPSGQQPVRREITVGGERLIPI